MTHDEIKQLKKAFATLMGINGVKYVKEIIEQNMLSPKSYKEILENVIYNSEDSIKKYFGIIQWYYFQYVRTIDNYEL